MAKRKITVTVDAELVAAIHRLGVDNLSSVVNVALGEEVGRRSRALALQRTLDEWEDELGPVPPEAAAEAAAAFDDADAVAVERDRSARSSPGAA